MKTRRICVAGGSNFSDYTLLRNTLNDYLSFVKKDEVEIVSGRAIGADTLAIYYAFEYNIATKDFPANWTKYGKSAGMIRNSEMAKYCTEAIIFWNGYSVGTKNMIDTMNKLDKPVKVILYE